jgi:hypothetical protein
VADFEHWEESKREAEEQSDEPVLCPICQEANLLASFTREGSGYFTTITCPNHMDGSCPLLLRTQHNLTLQDLEERLREAYDQHSGYCSHDLSFTVPAAYEDMGDAQEGGVNLLATCPECHTKMALL